MSDKEYIKLFFSFFLEREFVISVLYMASIYAAIYLGWWLL